jgi:hypothetical protein
MLLFAPIRWALKLIYFAVLGSVVYVIVSGVQVVTSSHLPTAASAAGTASDIVVLGAPAVGVSPGQDFEARLTQAVQLYRAKAAPRIIVVGAPALGANEAQTSVAQRWLVSRGVPAGAISLVSAPSAASGLPLVGAKLRGSATDVIVVTDAIDALWTRNAAGKVGLNAKISPAQNTEIPVYNEFGPLWREATGVAVGRIIGYGRTTWAAG